LINCISDNYSAKSRVSKTQISLTFMSYLGWIGIPELTENELATFSCKIWVCWRNEHYSFSNYKFEN